MAFYIVTIGINYIADGRGNITASVSQPEKHMSVYIDDFGFIWEKVQSSDEYPLLKKVFKDPYGDEGEIFIDQLEQAASEVQQFKNQLETDASESVKNVTTQYGELIQFAIDNRLSIIYLPD